MGSRYYGPLTEHDSTGSVKKKYINALGRCIAFVDSASNPHWMHQDAQGSTKLITNSSGTAENAYKYYPFGDSHNFTGTVKNDVKYTGQSYVEGIEAYDYGARYYDPELGRFYSRDPLGSAATSPYAYCGNNPVNFTDPSGMVALPFNPDMVGGPGGGGDAVTNCSGYGRAANWTDASGGWGIGEWRAEIRKGWAGYAKRVQKQAAERAKGAVYDPNYLPTKEGAGNDNSGKVKLPNRIEYERGADKLAVFYNGELHTFPATNNADSESNGPWENGEYGFKEWTDHSDMWFDENSIYGSHGNFVFNYEGRIGMGIHSGRENKGGYTHPTYGCIRTTDIGTGYLFDIYHSTGYLPTLYVQ